MGIKVNYDKCCWKDGKCTNCDCEGVCADCIDACPVQAISRKDVLEIDEEKCINCGACISACKYKALSFN